MKNISYDGSVGVPYDDVSKPIVQFSKSKSFGSCQSKQKKTVSVMDWMNKFGRKAEQCTQDIREHVKLGSKISGAAKRKLSLGARILQAGSMYRVFKHLFGIVEGEKLLKASQCYLSTSDGPIAGLLFISTEKVAFHSDKPLTLSSPEGDILKIPYKVLIPTRKIKSVSPSENIHNPKQKYMQIVTVDDFEFWFMGFVSYRRSLKNLEMAVFQLPLKQYKRSNTF